MKNIYELVEKREQQNTAREQISGQNQLFVLEGRVDIINAHTSVSAISLILVMLFGVLPQTVRQVIDSNAISQNWIGLLVVALGGLFIILARCLMRKKISFLLAKQIFKSLSYYSGYCIFNLVAFLVMLIFILNNLQGYNFFTLGGYYLVAWLVGLITPGAPGGIGVREFILIMLLSSSIPENNILLAVVTMRVITVMGDVIAYFVGAWVKNN